jgi:hypothetical protein
MSKLVPATAVVGTATFTCTSDTFPLAEAGLTLPKNTNKTASRLKIFFNVHLFDGINYKQDINTL